MNIKAELEALRDKMLTDGDDYVADYGFQLDAIIARLLPDAVVVRKVQEIDNPDEYEMGWNACLHTMLAAAEEANDDRG